jgi:hypothetical protein
MARPKSPLAKANARRQAEYKARQKERGMVRLNAWTDPAQSPATAASGADGLPEDERKRLLLEEELKAARQAGRRKEREKHYRKGWLRAMISVCGFFIRRERPDIARELVKEFNITHGECTEQGFDSFDLNILDTYSVFTDPPS